MTEVRQKIRGTTIQLDGQMGLAGLLAYNTDLKEGRFYDGVLLGGYRIPNLTTINTLYALPDRLDVDGATIADCNLAVAAGFYKTTTTTINNAVAASQGALLVIPSEDTAGGDVVQLWRHSNSVQFWMRSLFNTVWSPWIRLVDKTYGDTLYLGIVAQAFDSALLNGQNAAFYTNIIARLGYTPINKAGDSGIGALTLTGFLSSSNSATFTGVVAAGGMTSGGSTVFTALNDGLGSGLDADKFNALPITSFQQQLVGSVVMFSGAAVPGGVTNLDGSLISRSGVPALWSFAQASANIAASDGVWTDGKYSPGNGTTTFRVPDFRGRFARALDLSKGIDTGRAIGTVQANAVGPHEHLVQGGLSGGSGGLVRSSANTLTQAFVGATQLQAPGTATENRPENISVTFGVVDGSHV